jgi:hypothetical protein
MTDTRVTETHRRDDMKTQAETRYEFCQYFRCLKAENARDGANVNKGAEWATFIAAKIEAGDAPPEASAWVCPRFNAQLWEPRKAKA